MAPPSYVARRDQLEAYFDRTAVDAWKRLTSDAPVGRIRATVRKGRDEMRATLLSYLPQDLRGRRVLDAGCGTGALAIEAARRGAHVVAVDLSPTLLELARERAATVPGPGQVEFRAGDMLEMGRGEFDHVVAMDSLIHYGLTDVMPVITQLARRASHSMVFTFAPRTPALATMHAIGRFFPRGDRAPSIEPVQESVLRERIASDPALAGWRTGRSQRIASGFYQSNAMEIVRR
ncbi:MAG: magnesium protoporphyrin IX methyltransferase [Burkholderiales bacterium]